MIQQKAAACASKEERAATKKAGVVAMISMRGCRAMHPNTESSHSQVR